MNVRPSMHLSACVASTIACLALWTLAHPAAAQADTAQARQVTAEVNGQLPRLRMASLKARRPDVEFISDIRAWADAGGVRKIETTDHDDDGDVTTEYYYADGALVFIYQAIKGFKDTGRQVTRVEDRLYFRDGRLFKWLGGAEKIANAPGSAEFAAEERARLSASAFFLREAGRAFARDAPGASRASSAPVSPAGK